MSLNRADLLAIYNTQAAALERPTLKSFKDLATARERTAAICSETGVDLDLGDVEAEEINDLAETEALAEEIVASDNLMNTLQEQGAHQVANVYGATPGFDKAYFHAESKRLKAAGEIDALNLLRTRWYGHKDVQTYLATVARKNGKAA